MIYGYARCSLAEEKGQDLGRQVRELKAAGAQEIVTEREHGDSKIKKNLDLLFDAAKEGDTLICTEVSRLSRSTQGNPSEDVFFVGLWTGMRLSELLGLQWSCVDFDKGTIKVDKQLSWKRKGLDGRELAKTKNGKARTVTPPKGVMDRLRRIKTKQMEAKLRAKGLWNNELNLVFTDELGGCLPQTTVEHRFKKVCEKIGLDRHFHDLRHTFATEGIRLGIPVKTVSEELGHYSSSFTMDVYGHVTTQMQQEAAERLQRSLDERAGTG